jgi:chromosome partitioning protein
MAKVIAVIQEKGGTGKSTIATNLAGMAAGLLRVALVDADLPQGTSASWAAIRLQDKPENLTARTAGSYQELVELVQELDVTHDLVVIDAPPRVAETTKAALILSSLTLIPLGASAAEVWATSDLLKIIEAARVHKPSVEARILWNRFRASTRSAKELSEAVRTGLKLKQLGTRLGYRVAYSEALARGLTTLEWTDKQAQQEVRTLGKEIGHLLKITMVR